MSPADFWAATPWESDEYVVAAAWRERKAAKRSVMNAWLSVSLAGRRRMPPALQKFVSEDDRPKRKKRNGAQLLEFMKSFSRRHNRNLEKQDKQNG